MPEVENSTILIINVISPMSIYFVHWLNNEHFQYDSFPSSKCGTYTLSLLFIQTNNKDILPILSQIGISVSCRSEGKNDLFQFPFLEAVFSKCGPQNPALKPSQRVRKKYRLLNFTTDLLDKKPWGLEWVWPKDLKFKKHLVELIFGIKQPPFKWVIIHYNMDKIAISSFKTIS